MQSPKRRVCVMLCLNQLTYSSLSSSGDGGGSSGSSSSSSSRTMMIVVISDKHSCRNVYIITRAGGNGLSRCLLYSEVARGKVAELRCMNEYSSPPRPHPFPVLFPHGSPL